MIPVLVCVIGIAFQNPGTAKVHVLSDRDQDRLISVVDSNGADDWNDPSVSLARSRLCSERFGKPAELSWVESRPSPAVGGGA